MSHTKTLILSVAIACVSVAAAQSERAPEFYQRWTPLTSEKLMEKAKAVINNPEKRDSALVWYSIVANRLNEREQTVEEMGHSVGSMNNLGYMYFFCYYNYQKSYSYLSKALHLAEKHRLNEELPYIYLNLGNLYLVNDDMKENPVTVKRALDYYKLSFNAAARSKKWDILCIAVGNMSSLAYDFGDMRLVKQELDKFGRLSIPQDTPLLDYCRHLVKAYALTGAGKMEQAMAECDEAAKHVNAPNTPERFTLTAMGLKAHILSVMGDNDTAMKLFGEIEHIAEAADAKDFLLDIYREYSLFYKEKGDSVVAHRYRLKYLELKDSLFNDSQLKNVNEMQFLEELDRANERMAAIAREKDVQAAAMKVAIAIAVVIGAMLVALAVAYRRLRQKNAYLYEKSVEALKQDGEAPQVKHRTDSAEGDMIMEKIEKAMNDSSLICDSDFTLKRLADTIDEKYWTVSQVINERSGKNFNTLLAEHRVTEACRRFNDTANYAKFTVEAIALGVGFKSRSNFTQAFKRITGLAPSEYQRMAMKSGK